MKHYGPEPPWRGRSYHYGSWVWVKPSADSWFDEPGYWEWRAPARGLTGWMSGLVQDYYLPQLQHELNRELTIFTEWQIEVAQGSKLPFSEADQLVKGLT